MKWRSSSAFHCCVINSLNGVCLKPRAFLSPNPYGQGWDSLCHTRSPSRCWLRFLGGVDYSSTLMQWLGKCHSLWFKDGSLFVCCPLRGRPTLRSQGPWSSGHGALCVALLSHWVPVGFCKPSKKASLRITCCEGLTCLGLETLSQMNLNYICQTPSPSQSSTCLYS